MNNNLREKIDNLIWHCVYDDIGKEEAFNVRNQILSLLYSHLIKKLPKEIKKEFEANMLDGDRVEDCGGAMLSAKSVYEYLYQSISEIKQILKEELKGK